MVVNISEKNENLKINQLCWCRLFELDYIIFSYWCDNIQMLTFFSCFNPSISRMNPPGYILLIDTSAFTLHRKYNLMQLVAIIPFSYVFFFFLIFYPQERRLQKIHNANCEVDILKYFFFPPNGRIMEERDGFTGSWIFQEVLLKKKKKKDWPTFLEKIINIIFLNITQTWNIKKSFLHQGKIITWNVIVFLKLKL